MGRRPVPGKVVRCQTQTICQRTGRGVDVFLRHQPTCVCESRLSQKCETRTKVCGFPWLVLAGLSLGVPAFAGDRPGPIDQLRDLARAGRHEEVVAKAQVLLDATPPDRRSLAWSVDFNHFLVEDVRIGRRFLYFRRMAGGGGRGEGRPELVPDPKRARPGAGRYGWLVSVTCVDGVTGRRLWSRHFLPGTRMAVDSRDDLPLWTWHRDEGKSILRIDAATGDHTLRRPMPPAREGADAVRGVRVDGLRLWSYATANMRDLALGDELDLDTGEVRRELIHPALLAPDGRRALRCAVHQSPTEVRTTVMVVPDAAGMTARLACVVVRQPRVQRQPPRLVR